MLGKRDSWSHARKLDGGGWGTINLSSIIIIDDGEATPNVFSAIERGRLEPE